MCAYWHNHSTLRSIPDCLSVLLPLDMVCWGAMSGQREERVTSVSHNAVMVKNVQGICLLMSSLVQVC